MTFARHDAQWPSDTAGALYAARTPAELAGHAIAAVHRRFRLVISGCGEFASDGSRYQLHGLQADVAIPPDYAAYIHDHPIFPLLRAHTAPATIQLAQLITRPAWQRTDHFNGVARRMNFTDQIVATSQTATGLFDLAMCRDTVFSAPEYELVKLLQPHLHAAWRRVRPPAARAPGPNPEPISLSPGLCPFFLAAVQVRVLRAYFPRWREARGLPAELQAWVAHSLRQLRAEPPPHPLRAFVIDSARGRLLVRCFPQQHGGPPRLFLVETPATPDFPQLRRHGLTSRECEILHWIAQGKRDAEIAAILACAPATIGKHIENLLRKLSAENRGAAVSAARVWLSAAVAHKR